MLLLPKKDMIAGFEISESTFKNWRREGLPVYETRGNKNFYNFKDVLNWYIDYKRPVEILDSDGITKEEADLKLTIAREKSLQLDILRKKGKLVDIDDVDKSQSALASLFINILRRILTTISNKVIEIVISHTKVSRVTQNKIKKDVFRYVDDLINTNVNRLKKEAEQR